MVDDNSEYEFKCPDCNWSIPADEVKQKTGFKEQIFFCELCGARLIKYSINKFEEEIEIEQKPDEESRLFPVEIIATDPDYNAGFIDDLTLVLSRMIYVNIRMLEKARNLDLETTEFEETLLNYIADTIMPILRNDISPLFLKQLNRLSLPEFESNMKKLHTKLADIQIYRQNFIIYFRWLIRQVFLIVSSSWNKNDLEKFDATIINDLKHYEFDEIFASIQIAETTNSEDDAEELELNEVIEEFSSVINAQIDNLDQFKQFLQFTHGYVFIKDFVVEFNRSGNWIKNLKPTKRFIDALRMKEQQLKGSESKTNKIQNQVRVLSQYATLITQIKQQDILTKAIKSLMSENKGKFNAFDIQKWLLISDVSAWNQLKNMFPNNEYQEYVRTQIRVSIDTIIEIARKKGGKCHTKSIKNARSRLTLECAEGHHFYPTYNSVVYQDTWCPHCHIYVGEAICRQFFERIFRRPFPKSYPPWLINELGNQMELDGFCKELSLAFEYQGIQHRKRAFGLTDEDVQKIQHEDAYKLNKCDENNVLLLQIPDDEILPYEKMQDYIIQEYEKKSKKSLNNVPKFDYHDFIIHENKHAKKFREYVERKGGTLITPYFSAKKEITIMCENGHDWTTTPDSAYRDNWCSVCAGNVKGSSKEYRKMGEQFNCELISEYVNAKTPLKYKCPKGHKFTKDPYWLKRNLEKVKVLCPQCKMEQYADKFINFVEKRGGRLLTSYKGRFKTVKLECKLKHKWKTTPAVVQQGSWCPTCADVNHPNKLRKHKAKIEILEILKSLNYELLSDYENNTKQIQILCQHQHKFSMTPKYLKKLVQQQIEPCFKCRKANLD